MALVLRLAVVVAVALVLTPVGGSGGSRGNGLFGSVRKGPVMPVCQQGVPCDAPAQVTLVFSRSTAFGGTTQADPVSVRSNKNGRYRIALAPGYYATGTEIPLASFEPGYYTFGVNVRDLNAPRDSAANKGIDRKQDFIVLKPDGSMPEHKAPTAPAAKPKPPKK